MLFDEDIAVVKVAVDVCNEHKVKKEILCSPGSFYNRDRYTFSDRRKLWQSTVKRKATSVLKNRVPTGIDIGKVIDTVAAVGMRMMTWAAYHEDVLQLSRDYCAKVSYGSFFTQQEIIDDRKAAEALIADENLGNQLKYKLACLYCLTDSIHALYSQFSEIDIVEFYDAENPSLVFQPGLVKFWTYSLMNDLDKLRGEGTCGQYELEMIVESGNKSAFKYWLEKPASKENDAIVNAALKTIGRMLKVLYRNPMLPDFDENTWDWIDMMYEGRYGREGLWTPIDHYIDVVFFLLSQMNGEQKLKFLKKDIEGVEYREWGIKCLKYSKLLEFLLNWPYQDRFMKTVGLMWEFLPENNYAYLLLKIVDKIEDDRIKYSEKIYDYRGLLMEFWRGSPEHFKKYVLSDHSILYDSCSGLATKTCTELLKKLINLSSVADEHIKVILASATAEEREKVFSSVYWMHVCVNLMKNNWELLDQFVTNHLKEEEADELKRKLTSDHVAQFDCVQLMRLNKWHAVESFIKWSASPEDEEKLRQKIVSTEAWKNVCDELMYKEEWQKLDDFLLKFFKSEDDVRKYKRQFTAREGVRSSCISDFIENGRWEAADSFLSWSALSEEEVKKLKKEMIVSADGIETCCSLFERDKGAAAIDRFIRWHNPLEEEVKELKKNLIFSDRGIKTCAELAMSDKLDVANDFVNYCLSSEEEMRELKRTVAHKEGNRVKSFLVHEHVPIYAKNKFPNWELTEKFLNWCFSTQEEIKQYKKTLLEVAGKEFHLTLIKCNQKEEAEAFLDWLGVSPEKKSELKEN